MATTTLTATTTFSNICALSRALTNGINRYEKRAQEELVYMATRSMGGREWEAAEAAHSVVADGFGDWLGFAEEGATRFKWESASSGAMIEATRTSSEVWELRFVGTDDLESRNGRESGYVFNFAQAVDPATIVAFHVEEGLLTQFDNWVTDGRKRDDEYRPANEVIDHVEKVGAAIEEAYTDLNFDEILDDRLAKEERLELDHGGRWR